MDTSIFSLDHVVKQPNGLFAIWVDFMDNFTYLNVPEDQLKDLLTARYDFPEEVTTKEIENGVNDIKPWTTISGNGLDRWNNHITAIKRVHKQDRYNQIMKDLETNQFIKY